MNLQPQMGRCGRLAAVLCALPAVVWAQLQVLPEDRPQQVFGGAARQIAVTLRNAAPEPTAAALRTRLYQTSTTTAILFRETAWKPLQVLPGQTITETATLDFPAVRAETRFLVQWLDATNTVLGKTEVRVFPTNLLATLRTLAGESPLGVFDPTDQLKPLLQNCAVPCRDLAEEGTDKFNGTLAIFGPFTAGTQMRSGLANDIRALAKRGVGVIWLQPPQPPHASLQPSFQLVRTPGGAVVVAQHTLVEHLSANPEAQLNLLHLAKLALNPVAFDLPQTESSN